MNYNKLTPEEERVIVYKGTEYPFTGKYVDFNDNGIYTCKRCGAALFRSGDKFDAHCGWPSFDDAIDSAVKQQPDTDGKRTEIVCAACGAHLGHVFYGEGFTAKDTRHCVNSVSLNFIPTDDEVKIDTAYFASGCFWGTEYHFIRAKGVTATNVGFMGGHTQKPTYKDVCTGTTGHAETTEIIFDPSKTDYETLVRLYFETHDFTQVNRQGPDVGTQYRSVIFYKNEEQKRIAQKYKDILTGMGYLVATSIEPASQFWKAEDYHQQYYDKKGGVPYCHIYRKIFTDN